MHGRAAVLIWRRHAAAKCGGGTQSKYDNLVSPFVLFWTLRAGNTPINVLASASSVRGVHKPDESRLGAAGPHTMLPQPVHRSARLQRECLCAFDVHILSWMPSDVAKPPKVPSGVADQPLSDAQTKLGARNRANNIKALGGNFDLFAGGQRRYWLFLLGAWLVETRSP